MRLCKLLLFGSCNCYIVAGAVPHGLYRMRPDLVPVVLAFHLLVLVYGPMTGNRFNLVIHLILIPEEGVVVRQVIDIFQVFFIVGEFNLFGKYYPGI